MAVLEIAQPLLVVEALFAVDFHHRLIEPQSRSAAAAVGVEFAAVEVGVAGIEHPAVAGLHRNAGVAPGVAGEGDHQDLGREAVECADPFEPEPGLARAGIRAPVADLVRLRVTKAAPGY